MEYWYDWPLQTRFYWAGAYHIGIIYQNFIIDLHDGTPYQINEVIYQASLNGVDEEDAIIEWGLWKDISSTL